MPLNFWTVWVIAALVCSKSVEKHCGLCRKTTGFWIGMVFSPSSASCLDEKGKLFHLCLNSIPYKIMAGPKCMVLLLAQWWGDLWGPWNAKPGDILCSKWAQMFTAPVKHCATWSQGPSSSDMWSYALISLVDLKPGTLRNIPLSYHNYQDREQEYLRILMKWNNRWN